MCEAVAGTSILFSINNKEFYQRVIVLLFVIWITMNNKIPFFEIWERDEKVS